MSQPTKRLRRRSPSRVELDTVAVSGLCPQIVNRLGGGWVELCSKPVAFGGTCAGHSRAAEVIDFFEGLLAFFMFVAQAERDAIEFDT